MNNFIDTRDLEEKRNELKQQILDDFNDKFDIQADDFDDIDRVISEEEFTVTDDTNGFLEYWEDEYEEIAEIDRVEDEVGSGWKYGVTLIDKDDFEGYAQELVEGIGDLPSNLPSYISNNIDWSGVADDLRQDYSELEYQGTTYLFRA